MKIAVLADIHANFIGLQSVAEHIEAWKPDYVMVAGDFINRGPRPLECLLFLKEKQQRRNWKIIRGNHEDYVLNHSNPNKPFTGFARVVHQASFWTYQKIKKNTSYLKTLPTIINHKDPSGDEMHVVHASMRGNRDGIYPETSEEDLQEKIRTNNLDDNIYSIPSVICVGHTHRSLIRYQNRTLVVNVGSAGLPFDGDCRLSYSQITRIHGEWKASIVRLDYDRTRAEKDFIDSGYLEFGGPLVKLVQIELRNAESHLYYWANQYQNRVLNGEISMDESVRQYIGIDNSKY